MRGAVAITTWMIVLASAGCAATRPEPVTADIAWVASGEFCEPETVLALPDDTLLVSNVCDFRERGNGFLTLLEKDGHVLDWRVVDGLDAPLGMALLADRLYVVDNNRLPVFSWPGYERLETIDLDTSVANDVAVALVAGPLIRYRDDDDIEIVTGDGISSANHGYAPRLQLALIPTGFDNTLIAIRLTGGR